MRANCSAVNSKGAPVVKSVAVTTRSGPRVRARQIAESASPVKRVEPVGQHVAAAVPGRGQAEQAPRRQGELDQVALEVVQQELRLEAGQRFVAKGGVVGGQDAAAGDPADQRHFVEQGGGPALQRERRGLQFLQYAEPEGSRTRPAAGQGDSGDDGPLDGTRGRQAGVRRCAGGFCHGRNEEQPASSSAARMRASRAFSRFIRAPRIPHNSKPRLGWKAMSGVLLKLTPSRVPLPRLRKGRLRCRGIARRSSGPPARAWREAASRVVRSTIPMGTRGAPTDAPASGMQVRARGEVGGYSLWPALERSSMCTTAG